MTKEGTCALTKTAGVHKRIRSLEDPTRNDSGCSQISFNLNDNKKPRRQTHCEQIQSSRRMFRAAFSNVRRR